MKITKSIISFLANNATNFILALILGVAINLFMPDVNPVNFAAIVTLSSFAIQTVALLFGKNISFPGFAFMALQKEVWSTDIQENLYANNKFLMWSVDHGAWIDYKTVHIPQAGANMAVVKNRQILPALINERQDTELTYNLNEYTAEPIVIRNIDELQLSYSKRMSVLGQYVDVLGDTVANQTLYTWAPSGASNIIRTSGTATANALAPSATGTRNSLTLLDIQKAKAMLDRMNVPQNDRVMIIPSDMYNSDLLSIPNIIQYFQNGSAVLTDGVQNKLFGFNIVVRASAVVYDNQATPVIKAVGDNGIPTSPAATDNNAVLFYQKNFVAKALGDIKVFYDEDKPEYYGSLFSALVMHGATKMRTSQIGVGVIVQQ